MDPEAQRSEVANADLPEKADGRAHQRQQEEAVVDAVRKAVRDIQFGSVLVKIHQGRVVGIETSTKLRLDGSAS